MGKGFRHLQVWQRSFAAANHIYTLTNQFPKSQQFSLAQQMQRCAVSVPSNIAEGANRESVKEYRQFLSIALGSLGELETQLLIAKTQQFIPTDTADSLLLELAELSKMMRSLIKKLKPV